jgi:teichuronic acid biosynthesis glycosyltransferase TuaC
LFAKYCWDSVIVKASSMKQTSGIKKAIIIPNGVNLNIVKPVLLNSVQSNQKAVLFAADPKRYAKNFPLAKEAVSMVENYNINLKVIYSLSHSEVLKEINKADILLVTSRWEGSPNIIKEAMACNCPVVTTNVGDVKWLFGGLEGYFITSFSPSDVAKKIGQALKFSEIKGRPQGRDRLIKLGLDSRLIAKKIIHVYNATIKTNMLTSE